MVKSLKPLLVAGAVALAIVSFLRSRFGQERTLDAGGWEPVDPA